MCGEFNQELCTRLHKENDREHEEIKDTLEKKIDEGEFSDLKTWVSKIDARLWYILIAIVIQIIVTVALD